MNSPSFVLLRFHLCLNPKHYLSSIEWKWLSSSLFLSRSPVVCANTGEYYQWFWLATWHQPWTIYSLSGSCRTNDFCCLRMDQKALRVTYRKANGLGKGKWNEIEQVSDLWKLMYWHEISQVKDTVKLLNLVPTCNRMVNLFGQIQWMLKPYKAFVQKDWRWHEGR